MIPRTYAHLIQLIRQNCKSFNIQQFPNLVLLLENILEFVAIQIISYVYEIPTDALRERMDLISLVISLMAAYFRLLTYVFIFNFPFILNLLNANLFLSHN